VIQELLDLGIEPIPDQPKTIHRALFSSATDRWTTPRALYAALDAEFHFTLDPCPANWDGERDGLAISWVGERIYCNPPYGRGVRAWLAKAEEAVLAVYLLPARTDTAWWHDYAMGATEIRFLRGRLRFGNAVNLAPFPSVVLVFSAEEGP
jgi:site-specific DNA-methyltransferase (adenine-specific)